MSKKKIICFIMSIVIIITTVFAGIKLHSDKVAKAAYTPVTVRELSGATTSYIIDKNAGTWVVFSDIKGNNWVTGVKEATYVDTITNKITTTYGYCVEASLKSPTKEDIFSLESLDEISTVSMDDATKNGLREILKKGYPNVTVKKSSDGKYDLDQGIMYYSTSIAIHIWLAKNGYDTLSPKYEKWITNFDFKKIDEYIKNNTTGYFGPYKNWTECVYAFDYCMELLKAAYNAKDKVYTIDIEPYSVQTLTKDGKKYESSYIINVENIENVYLSEETINKISGLKGVICDSSGAILTKNSILKDNDIITVSIPAKASNLETDITLIIRSEIEAVEDFDNILYAINESDKQDIVYYKYVQYNEIYSKVNMSIPAGGSITIIKKDEETGQTLSGAVFEIYKDSELKELIGTLTTDTNGRADIGPLVAGTYYIKEKTAPINYVENNTVHAITVSSNEITELTVYNNRVTGTISVTKTDENENLLSGAEFTIYAKEDIYSSGDTKIYEKGQEVKKVAYASDKDFIKIVKHYLKVKKICVRCRKD